MNSVLRGSVLLLGCGLAGCLSSTPPAPPVRYFDPLPALGGEAGAARPGVALRVVAAAHLGREFAVRTAEREIVFDPLHSWIAAPRELVESTLGRATAVAGPGAPVVEVVVVAFEVDLTNGPKAHVGIEVRGPGGAVHRLDGWAPALGGEPQQVAAAMAVALATLAQEWSRLGRG